MAKNLCVMGGIAGTLLFNLVILKTLQSMDHGFAMMIHVPCF
jgi:hypothetical protein